MVKQYVASYDNKRLVFNCEHVLSFTDHEGVTGVISEFGIGLRRTQLDFGLDNGLEFALWVYRNREALSDTLFWEVLREQFSYVADYWAISDYGDEDNLRYRVLHYGRSYDLREVFWHFPYSLEQQHLLLGNSEGGASVSLEASPLRGSAVEFRALAAENPVQFTNNKWPSANWTTLLNYTYKMQDETHGFYRGTPKYSEGVAYFGLELEVSTRLSPEEIQCIVTEVEPKQDPFFIFKQDSSISGRYHRKVEIVTVPCTPRYLKKNFTTFFNKLEALAAEKGKVVSDYFDVSPYLSNGLHIHIDRKAFGETRAPLPLKKFLLAMNCGDSLVDKMARRPVSLDAHSYCIRDQRARKYRKAAYLKESADSGATPRTSLVNLTPTHTVEVRMFQGIFDLNHILTSIRFLEAMLDFCQETPISAFGISNFSTPFKTFISKTRKYLPLEKELA